MKPFDEISTNAFLEVIVKCLGYFVMLPFFPGIEKMAVKGSIKT